MKFFPISSAALGIFLSALLVSGCKPARSFSWGAPAPATAPAAINNRTEEAWVVQEVCDAIVFLLHPDLLGQPAAVSRITAALVPGKPASFDVKEGPVSGKISLETSVWDPQTYQTWCSTVSAESAEAAGDHPDLLRELLTPDTDHLLALENTLSRQLHDRPRDPNLQVDAALLLGTMAWVDASGKFQDVRPLLNRMTAYLAVADHLGAKGPARETAELLRLVLLHDQADALRKVYLAKSMPDRIPTEWLTALHAAATLDWRITAPQAPRGSLLLQSIHLQILTGEMGAAAAGHFLQTLPPNPHLQWARTMNQVTNSVGQGHRFAGPILQLEMEDAAKIDRAYGLGGLLRNFQQHSPLILTKFDGLTSYQRPPEVRVIGLQLWAGHAQRHFFRGVA